MVSNKCINSLTILKIGICSSFILLIVGLLCAWNKPCIGWEANIYAETPLIFWISIIIAYLFGTTIILYSQFYRRLPKYIRVLGWTLIVFSAISILFLAIIRGYKVLNINGDTGTHLGSLSLLLEYGQITGTYYPGIYWEPASICLLTGVDPAVVLNIFPVILTCILLLSCILLAKTIFPKKGEICLACLIPLLLPFGSSPLFFSGSGGAYYGGLTIGNMVLIPLCLYMVFILLTKSINMVIPLLILNFSVIFYHPNASVAFGIIYIAAIIFSSVPFLGNRKVPKKSLIQLIISLLSLIAFFMLWLWSFFGHAIISGLISIFTAINASERGIKASVELLDSANAYGYGVDTIFKIAGIDIAIYGMLLFAGILFIIKFWNDNRYLLVKFLLILSVFFVGIVTVTILGNFIGSPDRFLPTLRIAGILLVGFVLYNLFHSLSSNSKKLKKIFHIGIIFTIIVSIGLISIPSYYSSPNTFSNSLQTMQTDYTGAETLIPRIDYNNIVSSGITFTTLDRYMDAIYGSEHLACSYANGFYHILPASGNVTSQNNQVPYHFGYDMGTSLAEKYPEGAYIFINDKDKKFYQEYYPEIMQYRWTPQDFKQLSFDQDINYVYNNGGMEMYGTVMK